MEENGRQGKGEMREEKELRTAGKERGYRKRQAGEEEELQGGDKEKKSNV